jgi:hypothetical protein
MEIKAKDLGKLVELPVKPGWGPGKIMKIDAGHVHIRFRDCGDKTARKYHIDLNPLKWAEAQSDPQLDLIGPPHPHTKRRVAPRSLHLDYTQALGLFLSLYPLGFADPAYLGDAKKGERFRLENASRVFLDKLGGGQLGRLLESRNFAVLAQKARKVLEAQDLLRQSELKSFLALLKDEKRSFAYFTALAGVLEDGEVRHDSMHPYFEALRKNPAPGLAKWPIATLLPFLAQPQRHMFLDPQITQSFATVTGGRLIFEPQPNWRTYYSLMAMSAAYLHRLKAQGAKDYLDVQVFMTVIPAAAKAKKTV